MPIRKPTEAGPPPLASVTTRTASPIATKVEREGADRAAVDALAAHRPASPPGRRPGAAAGLSVGSETTITRQGRSPSTVCRVLS